MKYAIILAMAAASILLAGCDSDASNSIECDAGEVKADCSDGKYSMCVDGKWETVTCEGTCDAENKCSTPETCLCDDGTQCPKGNKDKCVSKCQDGAVDETCADGKYKKCKGGKWKDVACEGNASCNAKNKCGVCQNDAVDETCADGKYKKCKDGKWKDVACDGNASCNADNKCGVCQDDAVDETCADGKYKKCKGGKWEDVACKGNASCNAENKCGECTDGDEKADCKNGKYSKCVNGKWTETKCADNASCTKEGTCGICHEGDIKDCENDASNIGMATICKDGQWSDTKVKCPSESGDVSCTADKKCGECLTDDSKNCENDSKTTIGKANLCIDGKWTDAAEECPNKSSCSVEDECYKCYNKCDDDYVCDKRCESCETSCILNAECKTKCGVCESKCGECTEFNTDANPITQKNCKEDANGVGSASFCINGTWKDNKCKYARGIDVSCYKKCPASNPNCSDEAEMESICGQCPNTKDKYICITSGGNVYGYTPAYLEELVRCENGVIVFEKACQQNTCEPTKGMCAVPPEPVD